MEMSRHATKNEQQSLKERLEMPELSSVDEAMLEEFFRILTGIALRIASERKLDSHKKLVKNSKIKIIRNKKPPCLITYENVAKIPGITNSEFFQVFSARHNPSEPVLFLKDAVEFMLQESANNKNKLEE
jgi:hypothetical protein